MNAIALVMPPSADLLDALLALKHALCDCEHGAKTQQIESFRALHGMSKQTVWRLLKNYAGYRSERKQRSDAGTSKVSDEVLTFVAASKGMGMRQDGRATKPTCVAMNIADANGLDVPVGSSQMNRLLRTRKLDTRTQANARNHIKMRAEHPNHVHQIDPSLCLIFYMGKSQRMMSEAEFNKNKPVALEKVRLKVWRYTRYDLASASIDVRYYEACGETQANLFEFLNWTWAQQAHRLSHGIPKFLLWDKGSANLGTGIVRLLDALNVRHETHAAHHPWAKGGVEKGNHIVETHFESRLREEPVETIAELNAASERWVRDYNANKIKHVDARVHRDDGIAHVRDDLWQLILRYPGALVRMPERKVCSWFLTGREETRQIRDNYISFVHPEIGKSRKYALGQWAEWYSQGDKVKVSPRLLAEGRIRVEIARLGAEPLLIEVDPEREFTAFGNLASATLIGHAYARVPETVAERQAEQIAAATYGADVSADQAREKLTRNVRPFQHRNEGKGIVAHSHLGVEDLPARVLPKASELDLRAEKTELERWNHAHMASWLRARMGSDWEPGITAELVRRWPDGATEEEMEQIYDDLSAGRTVDGRARLRSVG